MPFFDEQESKDPRFEHPWAAPATEMPSGRYAQSSRSDAEILEFFVALISMSISNVVFHKWAQKQGRLIRYGLAPLVSVGSYYGTESLKKRYER